MAKAMFGAGCFWGIESAFRKVPGVTDAAVGYAGGTADEPSYEQVCSGRTGHAEVVQVEYDPAKVSYEQLLDTFWDVHDPTQLNRQGPDVGTQYRSVIFTYDEDQKAAAEASKADENSKLGGQVVTQIEDASTFWRAEEYHQRYEDKHPVRRLFGLG